MSMSDSYFNALVYHHVADNTPPSTSISVAQFENHLRFLKENDFKVVSLDEALNAIQNGTKLPEKAVAITFDDAFENIYQNALPLLIEYDYPFTVFTATDSVDRQFKDMMSWDQLRDLLKHKGTVANHSRFHEYMVRVDKNDKSHFQTLTKNIQFAQNRLQEELAETYSKQKRELPKWMAYPYGEYNNQLKNWLKQENYIAFGQQSGGIFSGSDFQALPRFPAAGIYSNLKTLKTKLESRPLPVNYSLLPNPVTSKNSPDITVYWQQARQAAPSLNCFYNGEVVTPKHSDDGKSFQLPMIKTNQTGRHRINCTERFPSTNRYYWFSYQWLVWP